MLKHNKPKDRKTGIGKFKCTRCGQFGSHVHKYDLHLCRQCFRDLALELGFKKFGHEV
ncbi:MAG TPA: 30S ribosomal protein S14 [Candidatus Woesearchaeota archaeon]|nr:30S ribosomal protein S14 [Candidatus Woesearchaeota archaeon]